MKHILITIAAVVLAGGGRAALGLGDIRLSHKLCDFNQVYKLFTCIAIGLLGSIATYGQDIVEVASKSGKFGILLEAAKKAQLVEALKSDGPLTIFAPTDEAFAKLPKKTLNQLLQPENIGMLQTVLKYHVVSGRFKSNNLPILPLSTLADQDVNFSVSNETVFINKSKITQVDIEATNGIVHVIDSVLIPELPSIIPTAKALISKSISMGVPQFNHGNHTACASIYEMTLLCLSMLPENQLDSESKQLVLKSMKSLLKLDSATEKSWEARKCLDQVMASLK